MSLRSRLRTVFLLAVLEVGAMSGVPMPPEKIRALMDSINRQKLAHTLPSEQRVGAGPATGNCCHGSPRPRPCGREGAGRIAAGEVERRLPAQGPGGLSHRYR